MRRQIDPSIKQQAIRLYKEEGMTPSQIEKLLEVPHETLRYWTDPEFRDKKRKQARVRTQKYARKVGANEMARRGKQWRLDNPEANLLTKARQRAKKNGLECTITIEDIKIPTHCPYLGTLISRYGGSGPDVPTLDRINPNRGYVPGNIIVVSFKANTMKHNSYPSEVINLGRRIESLVRADSRFQFESKSP